MNISLWSSITAGFGFWFGKFLFGLVIFVAILLVLLLIYVHASIAEHIKYRVNGKLGKYYQKRVLELAEKFTAGVTEVTYIQILISTSPNRIFSNDIDVLLIKKILRKFVKDGTMYTLNIPNSNDSSLTYYLNKK